MQTIYRSKYSYSGPISMLKRLANGDLVLAFREARWTGIQTHHAMTTRTSLIRSTDGGETWHSQVTPDPAGGNGTTVNQLSDETLIVTNFRWVFVPLDRKTELQDKGRFTELETEGLATAIDGVFVTTSQTDGYTWEPVRKMETPDFHMASTAGKVIELDDGSLLAPLAGTKTRDDSSRTWVMRSTDRGLTWQEHGTMGHQDSGPSFHEPRIVMLPDGRILGMMRTPSANFYQAHSSNGGQTWSPVKETPIWCGGSSPPDLLLLEDGRVLCTYGHRREPFGVRACLSEDGGDTWDLDSEVVLRDGGLGRDMGYPTSEQLENGDILTVYYWQDGDEVRYLAGTQ
ncbi:MAG: sialidase family protein, partial [Candidatus Latescibacteria bacterium]|nr:sialidase family protein [Candidatus Latescibacterota bacterium]